MRVLAHNDGREMRGNERQLLMLATGLKQRGHDVLVSCRDGAPLDRALRAAGVATTRLRPRGDLDFLAAQRFARAIHRFKPDAVLLTSWKRIVTAAFAAKNSLLQPRVVVRLGIVREFPRGWSGRVLRFVFTNYVDALVANSADVAETWLRTAPWFRRELVHTIPNAVERVGGRSIRDRLGVGGTAQVVLYAGGLERRKGVDVLLRALQQIPGVQLLVAGQGRQADTLRELAAALSVSDRVHWLGHREDMADLLASADAFVMPSRQDSMSNALLEAMSAGLPVVAAAGTGMGEALAPRERRGAAGWIVPPEDPIALAQALAEALTTAAAETRAAEARWRAANWFVPRLMVERYEQVLGATASPSV